MSARNYTYYDCTKCMCSVCLERVDTKFIFQDDNVFMLKNCLDHGSEKTLIATDVDYYKKIRHYIKPSDLPKNFNTKVEHGCPYDCGLCTDHEQYSCVTIVGITDRGNLLTCPTSMPRRSRSAIL